MGYPEYLSRILREKTGMLWPAVNCGVNGETTLQILRRADRQLREFTDVEIWCLCAGMNDCRVGTSVEIFRETYRQLLERFLVMGKKLFVATMPEISRDRGHLPYTKESVKLWGPLTDATVELTKEFGYPLVDLMNMPEDETMMADSVHPTDKGCFWVAAQFAKAIMKAGA